MMLRVACLLVIVSQLLLIPLYIQATGWRAIVFSFVANPTLAIGLMLGLLWWIRSKEE